MLDHRLSAAFHISNLTMPALSIFHGDYWDENEELFVKLPGIGFLMRGLRKAFAAPSASGCAAY